MISRHLVKMLIGLVGMGLIGLISMFLIDMYQKQSSPQAQNVPTSSTASLNSTQ